MQCRIRTRTEQPCAQIDQISRYAIFQPDIKAIESADNIFEFAKDQMGIWYRVSSAALNGRSISDLNVRVETGATISAIKRGEVTYAFPDPAFQLELKDEVYARRSKAPSF